MGTTLTIKSSKSIVRGVNFGILGRRVLLGFCFLRPQRLGRSPRSTKLDILFLFPVWMANFWTTKGVVVSSWTWTSLSPLVTASSLFSFMVAIHVTKKAKLKKKKEKRKEKKRRMDDTYFDGWFLYV